MEGERKLGTYKIRDIERVHGAYGTCTVTNQRVIFEWGNVVEQHSLAIIESVYTDKKVIAGKILKVPALVIRLANGRSNSVRCDTEEVANQIAKAIVNAMRIV